MKTTKNDLTEAIDRKLRGLIDDIAETVPEDASDSLQALLHDFFDQQYADFGEIREPECVKLARAVADPEQRSDLRVLTEQDVRDAADDPDSIINEVERDNINEQDDAVAYVPAYDDYIRIGNPSDVAQYKKQEARYTELTPEDIEVFESIKERAGDFHSEIERTVKKRGISGNRRQLAMEQQASRAWSEVAQHFE